MDGATVPKIIGETCDYGGCVASLRVVAEFTDGNLGMCQHHWRQSEDTIVVLAGFIRVAEVGQPRPAVHV